MVLLKNEKNTLPIRKGTKVALFGKGTVDYVKGGGGSGDVTVSYIRNLYEGFKELPERAGVYEELADFYRENVRKQYVKTTAFIETKQIIQAKIKKISCIVLEL